jgi:hypothetical protein
MTVTVKGNVRGMRGVAKAIKAMPKVVGIEVAKRSSGALTAEAGASWDAGQTVYGSARPLGTHGNKLTLKKTGAARSLIKFIAAGTRMTASLPLKYFRYLIGKYNVMPTGATLPIKWVRRINDAADQVIPETLRRSA